MYGYCKLNRGPSQSYKVYRILDFDVEDGLVQLEGGCWFLQEKEVLVISEQEAKEILTECLRAKRGEDY